MADGIGRGFVGDGVADEDVVGQAYASDFDRLVCFG
jgi:hypothetical protein